MSKETLSYLSLLVIIASFSASAGDNLVSDYMADIGDQGYDDLEIEEREMPQDLVSEIRNKTDFELEMEECMTDFFQCKRGRFDTTHMQPVCAEHGNTTEKKTFDNFCYMTYESCKEIILDGMGWHYYTDGPCSDHYLVPKPAAPKPSEQVLIPDQISKDSPIPVDPSNVEEITEDSPVPVDPSNVEEITEDSPIPVEPSKVEELPETSPIPIQPNEDKEPS